MIDYSEAGKRFASQAELLGCFAEILDLHIYYHYKYHFWVSPDSNIQSMLGVVVTREEFEKNLLKTSDSRIFPGLTDEEREEIAMMRNFFFGRVMATPESCGFLVFNMEVAFGKDRFEFLFRQAHTPHRGGLCAFVCGFSGGRRLAPGFGGLQRLRGYAASFRNIHQHARSCAEAA